MTDEEKMALLLGKMEAVADAVSSIADIRGVVDALSARMDAAEEEKKADADKDGEIKDKGDPKDVAADRKDADCNMKKDSDGETSEEGKADTDEDKKADDDDKDKKADRKDADDGEDMADSVRVSKAEWASVQASIAALQKSAPRIMADAERERFATIQEQAEPAFQAFGDRAPRPMDGETPTQYRRRLIGKMVTHSPDWKDANLKAADDSLLDVASRAVFADAITAANRGADVPAGRLVRTESISATGHREVNYKGTPGAWMGEFSHGAVN